MMKIKKQKVQKYTKYKIDVDTLKEDQKNLQKIIN